MRPPLAVTPDGLAAGLAALGAGAASAAGASAASGVVSGVAVCASGFASGVAAGAGAGVASVLPAAFCDAQPPTEITPNSAVIASVFMLAVNLGPHIIRRMLFWSLPLAFWFLMFGVFLVISAVRGMPRTARIDRVTRSPYLPRVVMEFGYWMMDAPANLFVRLGITPNAITTLSLLFTITAAACYGAG